MENGVGAKAWELGQFRGEGLRDFGDEARDATDRALASVASAREIICG